MRVRPQNSASMLGNGSLLPTLVAIVVTIGAIAKLTGVSLDPRPAVSATSQASARLGEHNSMSVAPVPAQPVQKTVQAPLTTP